MRRMTPRLATAALLASLALLAASATRADAASVQTYAYLTSGEIAGMSSVQPIDFVGASGTLTGPGSFILGSFTTSPLPASATLTYANTPFTIDLKVFDYQPSIPNTAYPAAYGYDTDYKISGVLNGSITGAGLSSMFASITSITDAGDLGYKGEPPFPVSDIQVLAPQGIAAPTGPIAGTSLLAGQVVVPGFPLPPPAPEPTSIAAFAAALAGWAMRKKLARAKA